MGEVWSEKKFWEVSVGQVTKFRDQIDLCQSKSNLTGYSVVYIIQGGKKGDWMFKLAKLLNLEVRLICANQNQT